MSRAFGVPKVFLSEYDDATLSNIAAMEQFLWRNTVVPELRLLEDGFNRGLIGGYEMGGGGVKSWRLSLILRTSRRCRSRSLRKLSG